METQCALMNGEGDVLNVIVADLATYRPEPGLQVRAAEGAGPGDRFENGVLIRRSVATIPPVPESISDRQFFQHLAMAGLVTESEALAAVRTGEIPAALWSAIAALPSDSRFEAEMLLSGATSFSRHHPVTEALALALGYGTAQLDELWRAAARL